MLAPVIEQAAVERVTEDLELGAHTMVAVWARSPAVRAGLAELLQRAGLEVVVDFSPASTLPDVDAFVIDIPRGGAESDDWDSALVAAIEGSGVGIVQLVEALPHRWSEPSEGWQGHAWLRREATGEELAAAVQAVVAGLLVADRGLEEHVADEGDVALTERERQVLALMAAGLTNKAIALELGISEHTSKFHVGAVLSKLGAQSRAEAVSLAVRRGLLAL